MQVFPAGRGRNLLGGAGTKTRRLGSGVRIYKNASNRVIGLDSFEVTVDVQQLPTGPVMFHRSVNTINISRTVLHLDSGSRVVALVQTIGDYSSVQNNSGNFFIAQWNQKSADENDVQISFEQAGVAKIGDTI